MAMITLWIHIPCVLDPVCGASSSSYIFPAMKSKILPVSNQGCQAIVQDPVAVILEGV